MTKSLKKLQDENRELRQENSILKNAASGKEETIKQLRDIIIKKNFLLAQKSIPPLSEYFKFAQKTYDKDTIIRELQIKNQHLETTIKTIIKLSKE